jgi:hypothetical protein
MLAKYRSAPFVFRAVSQCFLLALFALAPVRLNAQETRQVMVGPGPQMAGPGVVAFQEKIEVVKGHPYQADATTETIQTLSDGSHITQKITAHIARDTEGRTMRSQTMSGIGPWAPASEKQVTFVTIFDPVAGQHIDYTSEAKTAHVLPMPSPNSLSPVHATFTSAAPSPGGNVILSSDAPPPGAAGGLVAGGVTVQGPVPAGAAPFPSNETTESLGNRSIEGLSAEGTRAKEVIPAGAIGNDKDIVSTRESWYSSELKVVLASVRNDPRFGEVHYSLANIQLKEPDPSLFQVPAGYTIERPNVHIENRP